MPNAEGAGARTETTSAWNVAGGGDSSAWGGEPSRRTHEDRKKSKAKSGIAVAFPRLRRHIRPSTDGPLGETAAPITKELLGSYASAARLETLLPSPVLAALIPRQRPTGGGRKAESKRRRRGRIDASADGDALVRGWAAAQRARAGRPYDVEPHTPGQPGDWIDSGQRKGCLAASVVGVPRPD